MEIIEVTPQMIPTNEALYGRPALVLEEWLTGTIPVVPNPCRIIARLNINGWQTVIIHFPETADKGIKEEIIEELGFGDAAEKRAKAIGYNHFYSKLMQAFKPKGEQNAHT